MDADRDSDLENDADASLPSAVPRASAEAGHVASADMSAARPVRPAEESADRVSCRPAT